MSEFVKREQVTALEVNVGDKIMVNGVICKVIRKQANFGGLGDYVVFDFFCEDRMGYYCDDQRFEFDDEFDKFIYN